MKDKVNLFGRQVDRDKVLNLDTFLSNLTEEQQDVITKMLTGKIEEYSEKMNRRPFSILALALKDENKVENYRGVIESDIKMFLDNCSFSKYLGKDLIEKIKRGSRIDRLDIFYYMKNSYNTVSSKLEIWDLSGWFEYQIWDNYVEVFNFLIALFEVHEPRREL